MGSAENTYVPIRRPLPDANQETPGVATRTSGGGSGDGIGGIGRDVRARREGNMYQVHEIGRGGRGGCTQNGRWWWI